MDFYKLGEAAANRDYGYAPAAGTAGTFLGVGPLAAGYTASLDDDTDDPLVRGVYAGGGNLAGTALGALAGGAAGNMYGRVRHNASPNNVDFEARGGGAKSKQRAFMAMLLGGGIGALTGGYFGTREGVKRHRHLEEEAREDAVPPEDSADKLSAHYLKKEAVSPDWVRARVQGAAQKVPYNRMVDWQGAMTAGQEPTVAQFLQKQRAGDSRGAAVAARHAQLRVNGAYAADNALQGMTPPPVAPRNPNYVSSNDDGRALPADFVMRPNHVDFNARTYEPPVGRTSRGNPANKLPAPKGIPPLLPHEEPEGW